MELKLNDVKSEDRRILAPCGIVCLGCDLYQDESLKAAKTVVEIWEGCNFVDTSKVMGMKTEDVVITLETLKKFISMREASGPCSGCNSDSGGIDHCADCAIVKCAKSKGFYTCAECEDYSLGSEYPCPHETSGSPLENKGARFALTCKRYSFTNLENLKRCREIGYPAFIAEMKEKTKCGWRTWQVISPEMVVSEDGPTIPE